MQMCFHYQFFVMHAVIICGDGERSYPVCFQVHSILNSKTKAFSLIVSLNRVLPSVLFGSHMNVFTYS